MCIRDRCWLEAKEESWSRRLNCISTSSAEASNMAEMLGEPHTCWTLCIKGLWGRYTTLCAFTLIDKSQQRNIGQEYLRGWTTLWRSVPSKSGTKMAILNSSKSSVLNRTTWWTTSKPRTRQSASLSLSNYSKAVTSITPPCIDAKRLIASLVTFSSGVTLIWRLRNSGHGKRASQFKSTKKRSLQEP